MGVDLKGAPAPLPCRVKISTEKDAAKAAAIKAAEAHRPKGADLEYRDPAGMYSADKPFWAEVSDARCEQQGIPRMQMQHVHAAQHAVPVFVGPCSNWYKMFASVLA